MRKTIFFKIFFGYLLIALGLSVLVLFFSYRAIKQSYNATFTSELTDLCRAVKPQVHAYIKSDNLPGLDQFIKNIGVQTHKRITIIDVDGNVAADSESDPKSMSNHKNRPEVQQALFGSTGKSLRYSSTIKENMLYIAVPVEIDGKTTAVLRSSMFLKDINTLLNNIMLKIINITVIILLIALFIAIIFSKSLSIPIAMLKEASQRIASGDFSAKVTLKSNDELKDLANNFNQMTEKISSLFNALNSKKEELNTIINSLTEGLLVVDKSDKIKFGNSSFKKIVQFNDIDGKYYWEVLRQQSFKVLMEKAGETKNVFAGELEIFENFYACSVVHLAGSEKIVVLHDITKIKNLENKKKEFVANVSHELRTPLTAIKGFAETLEDETSEQGRQYIDIIRKHSDRLISIVEDLLLLSKLEETSFKLETGKTNIKDVIETAIKIFEPKAKEKGLVIHFNDFGGVEAVEADQFRIEQVFINLIDNAVKYTDKGRIDITLKQSGSQIIITLADTGIGIPKENLPFIFERFYVVDKSRSRKSGGTGLGLSIVKHIINLHNGAITVESEPGKGSKFTIVLPGGKS